MAEVKRKVTWFGVELEVTEVPILASEEHYNEYRLEDGAIIRVACPTTAVFRIDLAADAQGNPYYWVQNGSVVNVLESPKKKS